jgi:hypothetical protein
MKAEDLKFPNKDFLNGKARHRLKEIDRLVSYHTLSEQEYDFIQKELDILATMTKSKTGEE